MQPILAIDVSKASSHAAIYLELNNPIMKPFIFTHDVKGLKTLFDLLNEISHNTGVKPIVVMEATGNYSKLLCHQFIKQGYLVHVFNPLMTTRLRKVLLGKLKLILLTLLELLMYFILVRPFLTLKTLN